MGRWGLDLCKLAPHEREALAVVGLLGIPQNDAVAIEENHPDPYAYVCEFAEVSLNDSSPGGRKHAAKICDRS